MSKVIVTLCIVVSTCLLIKISNVCPLHFSVGRTQHRMRHTLFHRILPTIPLLFQLGNVLSVPLDIALELGDPVFLIRLRHGKLAKNAVDVFPLVQLMDQVDQLFLRGFSGQGIFERTESDIFTRLLFVIDIDAGRGIVADDDHGKGDLFTVLFQNRDLVTDPVLYALRY